jgi:hypothetical protein
VRYLQRRYPDQQLVFFWDGAACHRYGKMREYLQQVNQGLPPEQL